ncbi:hypothetical protein ACHQJC_04725 [Raoultella planticola]|uniref:hypothetical protein n=1 Tax=Raoultella planticola TaxID=575 RepID=UPI00388EDAD0
MSIFSIFIVIPGCCRGDDVFLVIIAQLLETCFMHLPIIARRQRRYIQALARGAVRWLTLCLRQEQSGASLEHGNEIYRGRSQNDGCPPRRAEIIPSLVDNSIFSRRLMAVYRGILAP